MIILLPLDDRPCNWQFPAQLARIAGIRMAQPPRSLLGYFTAPGDPEGLQEWLEKAPAAQAAIFSVDMLCYGGLIASRRPYPSLKLARQRLQELRRWRERHPALPCYAFNVIMRLSITADSPRKLAAWRDVALFSQLSDRVERLGEKHWKGELESARRRIPGHILEDYLRARARNHAINREVIELVADGVLDFALFCQEDAAPAGLHVQEQQALLALAEELGVKDKVALFSGADEAALVLLTRAEMARQSRRPKVAVAYGSREGALRTALYEDRPIGENVLAHIAGAGADFVKSSQEADLTLLVHTPCGPQQEMGSIQAEANSRTTVYARRIARQAKELLGQGRAVAVADLAYCNGADPELVEALGAEQALPLLAGFAGWNTAGNSIGGALAQGLLGKAIASPRAASRQVGFLFSRLVDDYLYQSVVRQEANSLAVSLGASPLTLGEAKPQVEAFIRKRLKTLGKELFDRYFAGREIPGRIEELRSLKVQLPWPRTFEVEVNARIAAGE
jgi:hypothetical protein